MREFPPEEVTPFVFSDPTGKRWPRLRLMLLIAGVLFFLGTVVFVQTLFVTPKMDRAVFFAAVERPVESVAKAESSRANCLQVRCCGRNLRKRDKRQESLPARRRRRPSPRKLSGKKSPNNEVRLAFYANGDPYSYASLEQHAAQITHLCPEWMTVINGSGRFTNRW